MKTTKTKTPKKLVKKPIKETPVKKEKTYAFSYGTDKSSK